MWRIVSLIGSTNTTHSKYKTSKNEENIVKWEKKLSWKWEEINQIRK